MAYKDNMREEAEATVLAEMQDEQRRLMSLPDSASDDEDLFQAAMVGRAGPSRLQRLKAKIEASKMKGVPSPVGMPEYRGNPDLPPVDMPSVGPNLEVPPPVDMPEFGNPRREEEQARRAEAAFGRQGKRLGRVLDRQRQKSNRLKERMERQLEEQSAPEELQASATARDMYSKMYRRS